MHNGHYSYSYCVLARLSGRFARSIATISIVFRFYVQLIIDPWIDHVQDHPMGRNPNTLVLILGALHPQSGVSIRQLFRKLQSSSHFKCKGSRNNNKNMYYVIMVQELITIITVVIIRKYNTNTGNISYSNNSHTEVRSNNSDQHKHSTNSTSGPNI
jgi:hypothetical protein